MQSKRDYLVGLGLAKPGRGKFSNAAKDALAKAVADGVKFSDGEAQSSPIVKPADTTPKPAPVGIAAYRSPNEYRFPEGDYHVVADGKLPFGIKSLGLREVCQTCKLSLVDHRCNAPVVFGVPVRIIRKGE